MDGPKQFRDCPNNQMSFTLTDKTKLRVSTWNVGTLKRRSAEVIETLTRRKVDLCCVQEHRWAGGLLTNQVRWLKGKDSRMKFYWCGNSEGTGGAGILLAEKWSEKVHDVVRISDRILLLKLVIGKNVFTFVSLYAPQVNRDVADRDRFYDQLQSAVMKVPASEVLFFLGDWNGHVGADAVDYEEVHGGHGFGKRNPAGDRILEFAQANDLLVGNTQFIKRESHLVTYESGEGRTQIDYVLYRKSYQRSVTDVKVIPGEECTTQHFLLVCDFVVCCPPVKKRKFVPRLRSWKLRDPVLASEFHRSFKEKVAATAQSKESSSPETAWSNLKTPLMEAAAEVCGFSRKHQWKRQTWWWNERVDRAIRAKRAHFKTYRKLKKRGDTVGAQAAKEAYLEAKRHAKSEVWLAMSASSEETFKVVDPLGSNVFKIAKQMDQTNQDIAGEKCVRNDAGELSLSDDEKMKAWVEHYSKLLNVEFDWPRDLLPKAEPVEGPAPPVTTERIRSALGKMKNGKAAGPSGVTVEMLKASGEEGLESIRRLGELVYSEGEIPSEWEESYIQNLYKGKGDALDRGNYRGLKLTDQVMKVLEHDLQSHIRKMVNIDGMQFGFVPGKGTTDAIFIARQMQEKYRSVKKPLYFAFVDLEKAFDRVPRDVLWWALRSVGVEEWAVRAIQGMYANARSQVRVNGHYSEAFDVNVGVHQGSVLSPLLFTLVLEAISREFRTGAPRELLYADDLVIIADSLEECVARLMTWKEKMEQKGFRVNMKKTKFLVSGDGLGVLKKEGRFPCAVCCKGVGRNSICCSKCLLWVHKKCSGIKGRLSSDPDFVCSRCQGLARPIDGRPVKSVPVSGELLDVEDSFCYLGDMLGAGGGCTQAVIARCGVAWGKFRKLLPVLTSRHLPFKVKGRVYNSCVRAAMLHGSETWGPLSDDLKRLRRNDRAMIRWVCGVRHLHETSSEALLEKLGLVDIIAVLRSRRLRWYGHVMRSSDWIRKTMDMDPPGNSGPGRKPKSWSECVRGDITICNMEEVDPFDRVSWRACVKASASAAYP